LLVINNLTFRIGGRPLFESAGVRIPEGHKVGFVGRNGTGKSTLLKLIAGELHPDGGEIALPNRARMGMVSQTAPSGEVSLIDTVLAADRERAALLDEAETATDGERIAHIHERLLAIDAHAAPARAAAILAGLGFSEDEQQRPCNAFSGGWRMRVALAAVLFAQPDLLLLDEPTNHLDLEATLWLESYLKDYPGTILLVSHDRALLNSVPQHILHLAEKKLTLYKGSYDTFQKNRAEMLAQREAARGKQEADRKRIQAFVDRFRAKASKARQAQSRLKILEKMQPIAATVEDRSISFEFPEPQRLAPPLLRLDDVSVGYGERTVLSKLNLRIDPEDRIALLGANGNGKSTLIKLIGDRLAPMKGEVHRPPKLSAGYFAQHQEDELDLSISAFQQAQRWMPKATPEKVRTHLGGFGFSGERADTKIGSMSGGEKARFLFSMMARSAPEILLLDEPTNHLDIESRAALIEAINGFAGAVILVSHDFALLEACADELWLVQDGGCKRYDGDLDEYRALLLQSRRGEKREKPTPEQKAEAKAQRRASADLRARLAPLRKQAAEAEKRVHRLQAECNALETMLADPSLYERGGGAVAQAQKELGEVQAKLTSAEETWLAALEELELTEAQMSAA
jgi:ATP-binding cassette subfamily F protein 3